jgi:hypothetical protein
MHAPRYWLDYDLAALALLLVGLVAVGFSRSFLSS